MEITIVFMISSNPHIKKIFLFTYSELRYFDIIFVFCMYQRYTWKVKGIKLFLMQRLVSISFSDIVLYRNVWLL